MFAFYYPNNDVLNGGRPTPAAGIRRLRRRAGVGVARAIVGGSGGSRPCCSRGEDRAVGCITIVIPWVRFSR